MAKAACTVVMLAVVVVAMMTGLAESFSCGTVATDLYPCLGYVRTGGAVPENCCAGITSLYKAAASKADRQDVCKCMKNAASSIPGVNLDLAAGLPAKCGVSIPYKISFSTDCAKVQ